MRFTLLMAVIATAAGCGTTGAGVTVTNGYGTSGYVEAAPYGTTSEPVSEIDAYAMGVQAPTFEVFYQSLAPYGTWVDHRLYGRVFIPADRGYVPYQDGRWVYTASGWYWQDAEPFGWAVSHYGRWDFDVGYGWLWVPDTRWAPAWVDWRHSNDMVGWAPLPPHRRHVPAYERRWSFVHRDELTRDDLRRHVRRVDPVYVEQRTQPVAAPPVRVRPQPIPRYHVARPERPAIAPSPARPFPRDERQPVRGFERQPVRTYERQPVRGLERPIPPAREEHRVVPAPAPVRHDERPEVRGHGHRPPPAAVPPPRQINGPTQRHIAVPPADRGRGHDRDRDRGDRGKDHNRDERGRGHGKHPHDRD